MMEMSHVIQVLMALIGAIGFGWLFHVPGSKLIAIVLGGALDWIAYLVAFELTGGRVFAFFVAALATAAVAEVTARVLRTPVLTLMVRMMVPLVPGGDLYYTTLALVSGDTERFTHMGSLVLKEAGVISFGIILAGCTVQAVLHILALVRQGKKAR